MPAARQHRAEHFEPLALSHIRPHRCREELLARNDGIQFSEHIEVDGAIIFAHACKLGLEGIISERGDLSYRPMQGVGEDPANPAVLRIEDGTW